VTDGESEDGDCAVQDKMNQDSEQDEVDGTKIPQER